MDNAVLHSWFGLFLTMPSQSLSLIFPVHSSCHIKVSRSLSISHFRELGCRGLTPHLSFMSAVSPTAVCYPWLHTSVCTLVLVCGKVFCYSGEIFLCLVPFPASLRLPRPSGRHREIKGEKLGQQPSARCCHTDSLCLTDSAPTNPPTHYRVLVCVGFFNNLCQPFLTHPPTFFLLFSLIPL